MSADLSSAPTSVQPRLPAATPPAAEPQSSPLGTICVIFVALAFLPLFAMHHFSLWARPHYQFYPFVLFGSALLAYSRWKDVATLTPGSDFIAAIGFGFAWLLLLAAELVLSPSLAVVAGITFLAAGIHRIGGWPLMRTMFPAWAFLWILVPLPFGFDRRLVLGMQGLTSTWSSFMLDYFGVIHQLSGNVVEIPGRQLLVEEACAGVNSLFAILACSLFLILWLRRSWIRAGLLLLTSVFWVLVTNVIRVVTIAIAGDRYHIDLTEGLTHDMLGLCSFLLAVVLIWSTDRLFLFFKPSWGDEVVENPAASPVDSRQIRSFCTAPVAVAFALPLAIHILMNFVFAEPTVDRAIPERMAKIDDASLPKSLSGWTKVYYDEKTRTTASTFGEFSKTWYYQREGLIAAVSLDYPFAEFHDLWECYTGIGWEFAGKNIRADKSSTPDYFIEMSMTKPGLHFGYLLFSEFNPKGESLHFEGRWKNTFHRYEYALNSFKDWMTKTGARTPQKLRGPAFQFQTFAETSAPFTPADKANIDRLFAEATKILHSHLFDAK